MATARSETVPLRTEQDVVTARQAVRRLAQEVGFGLVDQTKLLTATSELARNAVVYGLGGVMTCELVEEDLRRGLRLHFVDHGPGIPDITQAMQDGWSSGHGMGLGLSGAKRLVHDFEIRSAPGQGTTVIIGRWR